MLVETRKIKPYQRNARKNDATVAKLAELIPRVGFNVPLVLDRKNVIVKGHARWKAAVKLGMTAVPCVYTDADEETIKLDRLADNRAQEFSTWDVELLSGELASLNLNFAFDLGTLNFELADNPRKTADAHALAPADDSPPSGRREEAAPAGREDRNDGGNGDKPYISDADVRDAYSLPVADYDEVTCDKCGNHMFIRHPGR